VISSQSSFKPIIEDSGARLVRGRIVTRSFESYRGAKEERCADALSLILALYQAAFGADYWMLPFAFAGPSPIG